MRLDKFLADSGCGSRKDVKDMIRSRRVTVNGAPVKDPGTAVSDTDSVLLDGEVISYSKYAYFMMNKPAGVITATEDRHQSTVLDLIKAPVPKGLSPVGRLDKDTVGLLLLTNDGELNHRLLSPKGHVPKKYFARLSPDADRLRLDDSDIAAFSDGIKLADMTCMPAKLSIISDLEAEVVIVEGKFHQVKRMFSSRGFSVVFLKRTSMGPLVLDPALPEGSYRPLSEDEIRSLSTYTTQPEQEAF